MFHDRYEKFQKPFRRARMRLFTSSFRIGSGTRVIDVGGTRFNWDLIAEKPDVTLLNVQGEEWADGNMRAMIYDGHKIPFGDNSFDVAYSNSVIEHVGDWSSIERFAREVKRMAPGYFVQTPNKHFPVEPHIIGIFAHWLPPSIGRHLVRFLSLWGLRYRPNLAQIDAQLARVRLLTAGDMRRLFPEAVIVKERFLFITKSIIAVKLPG